MTSLRRGPLAFVLLSALVLFPIFAAGLCCDDFMYARFAERWREAWATLPGARSRPLTTWALVGLLRLDPQAAWLMPALRIVQHGCNGWLVACVGHAGWRLSRLCSFFAGAAFVVWACHGEVYYHSALHDVTAATFVLLALLAAQRQRDAWLVVCAVAAYASKESAWVLPAVLLLMPALAWPARLRAACLCGAAWTLCLAGRLASSFGWRGQLESGIYADLSPGAMLHTVPKLLFRTLVPGTFDGQAWVAPIKAHPAWSMVLAGVGGILLARALRRMPAKGWLLVGAYTLALAPVHLLSVSVASAENSRYLYLPAIFFVLLLGTLCDGSGRPRRAVAIFSLCVLVPFAISLRHQGAFWQEAAARAAQTSRALLEVAAAHPQARTLYLACVPDSYAGAFAARNALEQVGPLLQPPRHVVVLATAYAGPSDGSGTNEACSLREDAGAFVVRAEAARPALAQPLLLQADRAVVGPFALSAGAARWAGRMDTIFMVGQGPLPADALLAWFDGARFVPIS